MARHTSFRIGGPCDAMLFPRSRGEIETAAALLRSAGERPFLLGNGTNLLVTDGPFHRVVLRLGEGFARTWVHGARLRAQSGVSLSQLAVTAAEAGLTGLEFAHGIPGSLGGGVSMNAGAYGREIKDAAADILWLDQDLTPQESGDGRFGYRRSRFSDTDCIILETTFSLTPDDPGAIRERMRELGARRRRSQPLDLPSAGSTFKRPAGGYAAALIEQAGLKGYAVGGAQVSEKHAGFVVNRGGATFDDVLRLIEHIREEVWRTSGVALEPEVKILQN